MKVKYVLIILALLLSAWMVLASLVDDWGRLEGGLANLSTFFQESMWPPNWSVLEAQSYPVCENDIEFFCSVGYLGMIETLKIAFVATILGFIGALCLSSFAALFKSTLMSPIDFMTSAITFSKEFTSVISHL